MRNIYILSRPSPNNGTKEERTPRTEAKAVQVVFRGAQVGEGTLGFLRPVRPEGEGRLQALPLQEVDDGATFSNPDV